MAALPRTHQVLTPSRLRARRQKRRRIIAALTLLGAVLLAAVVIGITYIPYIRVRDVAVSGTETVDPKAIEAAVRKSLSGTIWHIFPRNNAFLYDDAALSSSVRAAFPKISAAEVRLKNFHTVGVAVKERTPAALWCGSALSASVPCLSMDDTGVIFESAPEYSGSPYVRWFGPISAQEPLGASFVPDSFASLLPLIREIEREGLQTDTVEVRKDGDVFVSYRGDFSLYFTIYQKPESVLKSLHAAMRAPVLEGKQLTDLAYLDLRYSDSRLYYKMK
jgi:hypothetical protein